MELLAKSPLQALEEGHIKWQDYELFGRIQKKVLIDKIGKKEQVDKSSKIGKWYYGESRTGKSTKAREGNPYIKMLNKWFDDYEG